MVYISTLSYYYEVFMKFFFSEMHFPLRNGYFNVTIEFVDFYRGGEEFAKHQVSQEEGQSISGQDSSKQDGQVRS